jgi:hypothetical protein
MDHDNYDYSRIFEDPESDPDNLFSSAHDYFTAVQPGLSEAVVGHSSAYDCVGNAAVLTVFGSN